MINQLKSLRLSIGLSLMTILLANIPIFAADAYNIKVKVKGVPKDSACYFAHYYGISNTVKDTVKADKDGYLVFKGKKALLGGIYLVVVSGRKYFEFIVDKEQNFTLETDTVDFVKSMKIKGSEDNQLFYDYLNFIAKQHKKIEPFITLMQKTKNNKDSIALLRKDVNAIDKEVKDYKLQFIKDHPTSFVSKVFHSTEEVEIPDAPKLANGKTDSTFAFKYYKAHFFDNIDFNDDRILRTPIFYNKIKQYLETLTAQTPDSINVAADYIISKVKGNKELYKFCVSYITYTYETSKIMGMDAVFVHMAQKYYDYKTVTWLDSTQIYKIQARAKTLAPLLLFKKAPPIVLEDTSGAYQSLYSIKAKYTLVYLYDPDCGHCKKTTPILLELYNKIHTTKSFEVYAANVASEEKKWKDYVKELKAKWYNVADLHYHSYFRSDYDETVTPTMYLLNEKKEIIGKHMGVEQIEEIIDEFNKKELDEKKK
jgi:thiol-disulfide isomerase/thioredoxin